jgi:hypothetical protein
MLSGCSVGEQLIYSDKNITLYQRSSYFTTALEQGRAWTRTAIYTLSILSNLKYEQNEDHNHSNPHPRVQTTMT